MDIKEIAKRSQALVLEFQLLRTELKNYANEHESDAHKADKAYLYKANQYPGDLSPARIARVSNKLAHPN